jgi:hypothetical protein
MKSRKTERTPAELPIPTRRAKSGLRLIEKQQVDGDISLLLQNCDNLMQSFGLMVLTGCGPDSGWDRAGLTLDPPPDPTIPYS